MKKHYLVYKITNLINNMIYIGVHETFNKNDAYMGSGTYLKNAQNKYGLEFFKKEILFECKSQDEMFLKEAEIVNEQFVARLDTYNLKIGGNGDWDYINNSDDKHDFTSKGGYQKKETLLAMTPEEKKLYYQKVSLLRNELRLLWSEEHKQEVSNNISAGLKKYYETHPSLRKGTKHTIESRKKMSEHQCGEANSQYGTIWICNDLTKESKKILKTDPIPEGWRRGRIFKASIR